MKGFSLTAVSCLLDHLGGGVANDGNADLGET